VSGRSRTGAKRHLVVPAVLLTLTLALVIRVGDAADAPRDPGAEVQEVPAPLAADDLACRREAEERDLSRPPLVTAGQRVTSGLVTSCPTLFDGRSVTYVGELVGDLLHRRGGAWVQVNDDDYALVHGPLPAHREHAGTNSSLAVWLPDDTLGQVTGLGRPGLRGDVVRIEGMIVRTDPEDGGGLTLRARRLQVLRPSEAIEEPFDAGRAALALGSFLLAGILWVHRRTRSS
jgi:hypothetical protein